VVTVNRNRLEICDWRFTGRTGIPRGTAGRPDRGRGAVPSASLDARQNKAGTSFSFIEIVLATPVSIKDSDCEGAAAERGAGVLGSTASPYWTRQRQVKVMLGREPVEPQRHTGTESEKK
jgi:hypothetical protein